MNKRNIFQNFIFFLKTEDFKQKVIPKFDDISNDLLDLIFTPSIKSIQDIVINTMDLYILGKLIIKVIITLELFERIVVGGFIRDYTDLTTYRRNLMSSRNLFCRSRICDHFIQFSPMASALSCMKFVTSLIGALFYHSAYIHKDEFPITKIKDWYNKQFKLYSQIDNLISLNMIVIHPKVDMNLNSDRAKRFCARKTAISTKSPSPWQTSSLPPNYNVDVSLLRVDLGLNEDPWLELDDNLLRICISKQFRTHIQYTDNFIIDDESFEWLGDTVYEYIFTIKFFNKTVLNNLPIFEDKFTNYYEQIRRNTSLFCQATQKNLCQYLIMARSSPRIKHCADMIESILGMLFFYLVYIKKADSPFYKLAQWYDQQFNLDYQIDFIIKHGNLPYNTTFDISQFINHSTNYCQSQLPSPHHPSKHIHVKRKFHFQK